MSKDYRITPEQARRVAMMGFGVDMVDRVGQKLMSKEFPHGVWNILQEETRQKFRKQAADAIEETISILTEKGKMK